VEERRRWRRPAGQGSDRGEGIGKSIGRWLRGNKSDSAKAGPLTRAADHVPNLDFDEAKEHQPAARTRLNADLSKTRVP
jgi:hypothetical protein